MAGLTFRKLIAFDSLPAGWELVDLAIDWSGSPLLLMVEGKGRRPSPSPHPDALYRWNSTPAKAHHIVHLDGQSITSATVEEGVGNYGALLQPYEDGWVIANVRKWGGAVSLYSASGALSRSLHLGDGIADLQTLPNGQIWVSYFDEGVYGDDEFPHEGLVCFDRNGAPLFRFLQYAMANKLPRIDDCYALNVNMNGDVWVNYYMAFPLILLRDLQLAKLWPDFGCIGSTFAVRDSGILHFSMKGNLMFTSLDATREFESMDCLDQDANPIAPTPTRHLQAAARGSTFVLNTGTAVYATVE